VDNLVQMRSQIRKWHSKLDDHPVLRPLHGRRVQAADSGNLLTVLFHFFKAAEPAYISAARQHPVLQQFCRPRLPVLEQDNRLLQLPELDTSLTIHWTSLEHWTGYAYAVEGSANGIQRIRQNLDLSGTNAIQEQIQYFHNFNDRLPWKTLLVHLDSLAGSQLDDVVQGAIWVFQCMQELADKLPAQETALHEPAIEGKNA
jgi:hypothetical protein